MATARTLPRSGSRLRPPYRASWSTCGSSWGVSPAGAGAGIAGAGGLSAAYCSAELQNSVRADLKTPPLAPKCRKSCKTLLGIICTNIKALVRRFSTLAANSRVERNATFPTFCPHPHSPRGIFGALLCRQSTMQANHVQTKQNRATGSGGAVCAIGGALAAASALAQALPLALASVWFKPKP